MAAVLSGAPEDVSTFRRARLPAGVPPTTLVPAPELDALLPGHWAARVTIETPSGRSSHCVVDALGSPAHPPAGRGAQEVRHPDRRRLTAWRARCLTLDDLDSAAELTRPIT